MFEYHTRAIVLDKKTLNEADAEVILYTEVLGKLELVAKGAKKITAKLNSHLEVINLIEATIISANNKHLTSVLTINNFSRIRKDPIFLESVLRMLKIFNQAVIASEQDEFLWNILCQYLQTVEKGWQIEEKNKRLFVNLSNSRFLINLAKGIGIFPEKTELDQHFNQQTVLLANLLSKKTPLEIIKTPNLFKLEKINYNKIENEIRQKIIF